MKKLKLLKRRIEEKIEMTQTFYQIRREALKHSLDHENINSVSSLVLIIKNTGIRIQVLNEVLTLVDQLLDPGNDKYIEFSKPKRPASKRGGSRRKVLKKRDARLHKEVIEPYHLIKVPRTNNK